MSGQNGSEYFRHDFFQNTSLPLSPLFFQSVCTLTKVNDFDIVLTAGSITGCGVYCKKQ